MGGSPILLSLLACSPYSPALREVHLSSDRGSAWRALQDPTGTLRVEEFQLGTGARTPLIDILFVVDNSISMESALAELEAGVDAIAAEAAFPDRARMAVMSTLPGRPPKTWTSGSSAPWRPIAWLGPKEAAVYDPGFLDLVDAERIATFRREVPALADRFPLDGCAAWFHPADTNPQGDSCIAAHTQIAAEVGPVEAGLTAFAMRVVKGGPLFREGAAANVVFVSDTHDPGVLKDWKLYERMRPSHTALRKLVDRKHTLASFKLHAIAPRTECTRERWASIGPSYHEAARASGGQDLDFCDLEPEAWARLVRRIAEDSGEIRQPVLALGVDADEIHAVEVNGQTVRFSHRSGRGVLTLDQMPEKPSDVWVKFRPGGAAPIGTDER